MKSRRRVNSDVGCLVEEMKKMLAQRFYAAVWFMAAGVVPGVCIISYDLVQNGDLRSPLLFLILLYIIIPALLAAISGALFGADILNRKKTQNALHAAVRGFLVSLAAWLAYAPILTTLAGSSLQIGFAYRLFVVFLFGSLLVGWLIASVGIATALLLYRMRKFCPAM
jgi:hypothetical protein